MIRVVWERGRMTVTANGIRVVEVNTTDMQGVFAAHEVARTLARLAEALNLGHREERPL